MMSITANTIPMANIPYPIAPFSLKKMPAMIKTKAILASGVNFDLLFPGEIRNVKIKMMARATMAMITEIDEVPIIDKF